MAIIASQVTVATTATLLFTFTNEEQEVHLASNTGAATVFVGGSSAVTTSNGFPIVAATEHVFKGHVGDTLYGIVAASTQALGVASHGR